MQPIIIIKNTLYVMHNTSHGIKQSKTSHVSPSIGAICTRAFLAPRKILASMMLHDVVPHALLQRLSSDDMHILFINEFDSGTDLNSFDSIATDWFYIFLGYILNLDE
jgi:hypothetical protein